MRLSLGLTVPRWSDQGLAREDGHLRMKGNTVLQFSTNCSNLGKAIGLPRDTCSGCFRHRQNLKCSTACSVGRS